MVNWPEVGLDTVYHAVDHWPSRTYGEPEPLLEPQLRVAASGDPPKDVFIVPGGFVTSGGAGAGAAMMVIEPPLNRK